MSALRTFVSDRPGWTDRTHVLGHLAPLACGGAVGATAIAVLGSQLSARKLGAALAAAVVVAMLVRLTRGSRTLAAAVTLGLFAVIVLVPVDYLPLGKTAMSARLDPLLALALAGLVGPLPARTNRCVWPAVVLGIVVLSGAMAWLQSPTPTARYFYMSFVVSGAAVYLTAWRGSRLDGDLRTLSRALVAVGGVAAAFGVLEYALKRNPLYGSHFPLSSVASGGGFYFNSDTYRITTTIGHPLDVGAVLGVVFIVALGVARGAARSRERIAASAVAGLALTAVVMSKSRTDLVLVPLAGLAFILVAVHARRRGLTAAARRRSRGRTVMVAAALAMAVWSTHGIWSKRLSEQSSANSASARVIGLSYARQVVPSAMPFGLGFGASQAREGAQGMTVGSASAENGWLELLVDGGAVFALALLALPLAGGFSAIRRAAGDPVRLAHGVSAVFLALNAASFNGLVVSRPYLFLVLAEAAVALPAVTATTDPAQ